MLGQMILLFVDIFCRDLLCLRNMIHTNLMVSYILADFMWIFTLLVQVTHWLVYVFQKVVIEVFNPHMCDKVISYLEM